MKNLFLITSVVLLSFSNLTGQNPKGNGCYNSDDEVAEFESFKIAEEGLEAVSFALDVAAEVSSAVPGAGEGAIVATQVIGKLAKGASYVMSAVVSSFENHQMGNPWPYTIDWDKINSGVPAVFGAKSENDNILMTSKPGTGKLTFGNVGRNWKGLVLFDKNDTNKWKEFICLYNDYNAMSMPVTPTLGDDYYVVLSKAKALGVHTNMYLITNWNEARNDRDYNFTWLTD